MSYKASSSGEYDRYIQIKSKTRTQNEFGEETITLVLFAEAWAKKRSSAGKEFYAGTAGANGSKIAEEVMMYTFRYLPNLTHDMIIVDGSENFDITRISELGRQVETQVIAKTSAL
jgi:head-tail adaptor